MEHLKNLTLADPSFDQPGRVDLLIGCNLLQDVFMSEIKRGSSDQPVAMNTVFGWAILGRYKLESESFHSQPVHTCSITAQPSLDALLR